MTPTPGDLSARLLAYATRKAKARDALGVPAGDYVGQEEIDTLCQAAAALSALPAAGGVDVALSWLDDVLARMKGQLQSSDAAFDWKIVRDYHADLCRVRSNLTTPQPSAAVLEDGGPPCSTHPDAPHGFNRNASHTEGRYVCDCEGWKPDAAAEIVRDLCELDPYDPDAEDAVCVRLRDLELIVNRALNSQDAAVGAQGDGEEAAIDRMIARYLELEPGEKENGVAADHQPTRDFCRELLRAATPAAGKGVDDAMVDSVRADIMASAANEGRCDVVIKDEWVRAALEAALTRQPVAGDGMQKTTATDIDIAFHNAMQGLLYGKEETRDAYHWFELGWKAAPAATPTDGGEGTE